MASLETAGDNAQGQDDSGCVEDEPSPCKSDADPPPRVNLLDLSDDVLLWILQYCEACDLKALGFSCRRLGLLVCDRSLWCRVVARARPCGAARLRWFLALTHAHTRVLSLAGHARTGRKRKSDQDNSSDEELSKDRCANCESEMGSSSSSSSSPCGCPRGLPKDAPWRSMLENNMLNYMRSCNDAFEMYDSAEMAEEADTDPIYTATPALLKQLTARCPQLHTLELTYCNVDWSVTNMSQFPPTLKRLSFRGCKSYRLPTDKSCMFRVHQHLPLLEDLDLSSFDGVEGVTLLPVSKLPALRRLRLRNCKRLREFVAYASLSARYGFRQLQVLDIRGSTFSDSEISAFGWLPLLEELYISPEHYEGGSPFTAEMAEKELEDWELEEPSYYASRHLPSPEPASPPQPPSMAVFTVTIDRRHENRRVNVQMDGNGGDGDGGNGNLAAGNDIAADGNDAPERREDDAAIENARNGIHRNIRGRDVIFFVGGNPEVEGLPGNIGGEGNVIIVVGGRNANRDAYDGAENGAQRDGEEDGVPRNAAEGGAPRNEAPRNYPQENGALRHEVVNGAPRNEVEIGAPGNEIENGASRNVAPEIGAPSNDAAESSAHDFANGNGSNRNENPIDSSDEDNEENGGGDAPPAKKQRLSVPSSRNSNDNSMESTSNASIDNNAGSSNDAGPSNDDNRPRRYVKFRRNLPPVVVTENDNQNAPGPNVVDPMNAPAPDANRVNEGQVREPNVQHAIHVQRPQQNHRFFIQIDNEQFENDMPNRQYRTPLARNARRLPGCLLGMRNYHRPIHPALLVTDVTLKKFGHSDDEDEHVIRIDQRGAALGHSDRPNKSKLKKLVCSGYIRVTNRSLSHLATAAPELVFVDMRGTKVNEDGVKAFKALRPDCEVLYDDVVVDTDA